MKIILKKLLIISILVSVFVPIVTFATQNSTQIMQEEQEFFYADKKQAMQGDEITMTIDLSKIEYNNFEFTLSSNINLNEVVSDEEKIEANIEENEFKIVSNKTDISMEKISLYYKIPEEMQIGTKITLTGKIKEYIEEERDNENKIDEGTENTVSNDEIGDSSIQEEIVETKEKEVTITITIVENNVTSENENQDDKKEDNEKQESNKVEQTESQNKSQNESNNQNQTVQMSSVKTSSNSSTSQTITYKGESNNYLSSLSIDGYELNQTFSKTNTTYFIKVGNEVNSISINAICEDSNAKVKIYGNEGLKEGENKVLISVTAENGDVRMYRIYITK